MVKAVGIAHFAGATRARGAGGNYVQGRLCVDCGQPISDYNPYHEKQDTHRCHVCYNILRSASRVPQRPDIGNLLHWKSELSPSLWLKVCLHVRVMQRRWDEVHGTQP